MRTIQATPAHNAYRDELLTAMRAVVDKHQISAAESDRAPRGRHDRGARSDALHARDGYGHRGGERHPRE